MIIREQIPNTNLIKTYSDSGFMIEQVGTGLHYSEAIDPDFMNREYIEINEEKTDTE